MRTIRAALAVATCAVLLPTVAAAAPPRLTATAVRYDAAGTTRLYSLVNSHRRSIGLPALTVDAGLASIARTWTATMATKEELAHNDALFTSATHKLLGIKLLAENVAFASLGLDRAHVVLLESPHHRANIENPAYAVGGFAVVVDAKGVTWVTEDFGSRPRTAAPATTAPRPVATATAAPKPAAPAPRPAPRPAPAPRAAAPRPAAPAVVTPPAPRRDATADRVDVPAGSSPSVTHVAHRAATGSRGAAVPAAAAVLVLAALGGVVASGTRRRSVTLGA